MTDDHIHHDDARGELTSAGALLRAAADGEITAADQRRLDELLAEDPALESSIDFERQLRTATARVMGAVAVPAGLADRVRAAISADVESADPIEALNSQTRQRSFWSRKTWISAAAAILVLGLSAALIVQANQVSSVSLSSDQLAYRQQLAGFLTSQHEKTCEDLVKAQQGKLKFQDSTAYESELAKTLNHAVKVPSCDRSRKVYFAGGGRCGVPGEGPSGHMVYNAEFAPDISVFIKLDHGELPLKEGRTYALDTKDCGMPGTRILTRSADGVLYFFVFNEGDGCQKALEALGVGSPSARY